MYNGSVLLYDTPKSNSIICILLYQMVIQKSRICPSICKNMWIFFFLSHEVQCIVYPASFDDYHQQFVGRYLQVESSPPSTCQKYWGKLITWDMSSKGINITVMIR